MEEVKVIPPATKNSSFLVTLLSVLLLISVFIAGFFAYQTQNLVKELTKTQITPSPTPTLTNYELPWVNPWYPRLRLRRVRNSSIHSRLKA